MIISRNRHKNCFGILNTEAAKIYRITNQRKLSSVSARPNLTYVHHRRSLPLFWPRTDLLTSLLTFLWWFDLTMILISLYSVSFHFIFMVFIIIYHSFYFRALEYQTNNAELGIPLQHFTFPVGLKKYRGQQLEPKIIKIFIVTDKHIWQVEIDCLNF